MATLILQDTYRALEEEMKAIDKLKRETSIKIRDAASHGDLKENAEYHAAGNNWIEASCTLMEFTKQ